MKARILTTLAAAAIVAACGGGSEADQEAGASAEPGTTGTLPSRAAEVEGGTTPVDTLTADPSTTPGVGSPVAGAGASTTVGAGGASAPAGAPATPGTVNPAGQPTPPASRTAAPNAPDAMVSPAARGDTAGHTGHTP